PADHPRITSRPAGIFDRWLDGLCGLEVALCDNLYGTFVGACCRIRRNGRRGRSALRRGLRLGRSKPTIWILVGRGLGLRLLLRDRWQRDRDGSRGNPYGLNAHCPPEAL